MSKLDLTKPSRALDALVAEKIFGHQVVFKTWAKGRMKSWTIGEPDYIYTADEPGGILTNVVLGYSDDWAAAGQVVAKLNQQGFCFAMKTLEDGRAHAVFSKDKYMADDLENGFYEAGDSAPLAICLAALKAVGAL